MLASGVSLRKNAHGGQHGLTSPARADRHCRAANLTFRSDHELPIQHKHVPKRKIRTACTSRSNMYPQRRIHHENCCSFRSEASPVKSRLQARFVVVEAMSHRAIEW